MAKSNIKKRPNKSLILSITRDSSHKKRIYSGEENTPSLGGKVAGGLNKGLNVASGILGMAGTMADTFNKNSEIKDTTEEQNLINETASTNYEDAGDFDSLLDSFGVVNAAKDDYTMQDVRGSTEGERWKNGISGTLSATTQGASAGSSFGPWGAVAGAAVGLLGGIGTALGGSAKGNEKAQAEADRLNREAAIANYNNQMKFQNQAQELSQNQANTFSKNIVAYGGPLMFPDGGQLPASYSGRVAYDNVDFSNAGEPFEVPEGFGYFVDKGTNRVSRYRTGVGSGNSRMIDEWNAARLATGKYNDQLGNGQLELQKSNRDKAVFTYSPDKDITYLPYNQTSAAGYFNKKTNNGWVGSDALTKRPTLVTHEKAHASRAIPQQNVIKGILGTKYTDKYYDDPDEVYSRLMEIRQAYDLDPLKTYNKDDVNNLKKRGFQNDFLDRYDNDTLVRLLNDVANNSNMDYTNYAKDGGKIHIKPSKKGTFTEAAKKHGMGVQEFARKVLANKDNYSPAMVKKANFARNAAGWKHDLGGHLFTHGGDWTNELSTIDAGGTHEQNPYQGVPMGVAPDGQPNLVEQGEVVFNGYVFSNRLHPTEKELKEANLPKRYKDSTFAYIAEDMGKESAERPNDPISRRGLEDSMMKLAMIQEAQRARKGKEGTQQMMAFGGRKFAGGGPRGMNPALIGPEAYNNMVLLQQLIMSLPSQ